MANIICIVCPKGCRLTVDENTLAVTGNGCPRGAEYGKNELTHPVRVVTSTVRVEGADICRCPVKTAGSVPKEKMFAVMDALDGVCLHAPVHCGDVVLADVCGTGVDVVARGSCRRRNKGENKKGEGLSPSLFACRKPLAGRAVQKKDNADDEKSL